MRIGILVLLFVFCFSCAAGPNPSAQGVNEEGKTAGFFMGLWHGIILPVTTIVSIFNSSVNVYEVYNDGIAYNIGYLLGVAIILGGGSGSSRAFRKRRQ
ncbi:MAG: hypothetical protein JW904_10375 [Spirochaetales bacterium]|nr:hypothetical protein [Spirochaetales bacterium]